MSAAAAQTETPPVVTDGGAGATGTATEGQQGTVITNPPPEGQTAAGEPPKTVVTDPPKEGEAPKAGPWPEDWRDKFAGEDKAFRGMLDRYASPEALAKAHRELQVKASSGQLKATLPENPSAEELTAWRKEQGIPETAEGYKVEIPEGRVFGEEDKPLLKTFADAAHASNLSDAQVNGIMKWYFDQQDSLNMSMWEKDSGVKQKTEDDLRVEWGAQYRSEIAGLNRLVAEMPDGLGADLLAARTPDGHQLGNDPRMLRYLAGLRRELMPMASLVPAGTGDPMKAGQERIKEIETMMRDEKGGGKERYWKGPESEAIQTEYRNLLEARERSNSRN